MLSDLARWNHPVLTADLLGHPNHFRAVIQRRDVEAVNALSAGRQMEYSGVDYSEWQRPNPDWTATQPLRELSTRLCDGAYYDPTFAGSWQAMQSQPARYKGFYVLPDPRLGWRAQGDYVKAFFARGEVSFGAPGHWYSIDDESTTGHGQFKDAEMRNLRAYLEDIFQREELHYVGLYNGNYGFVRDEGWQLWAPWPLNSNGALPAWTTNFVLWQWGVAGPGEVWGFPNADVDVNMLMDTAVMDRLAGFDAPTPPAPPVAKGLLDFMATNDEAWALLNHLNDVLGNIRDVLIETRQVGWDARGAAQTATAEVHSAALAAATAADAAAKQRAAIAEAIAGLDVANVGGGLTGAQLKAALQAFANALG